VFPRASAVNLRTFRTFGVAADDSVVALVVVFVDADVDAGASGDFNPIHYRDDVAMSVGLEGVLAHGMLTMGLAVAPVTVWLGDRGFVSSFQVRFTKPVYVPAESSVIVAVSVSLAKVDEPAAGSATLALSVTTRDGTTVLGKAFVVVSPR